MKTFLIHSLGDNADTTWIVNANNRKEAIQYVKNDEDFYDDFYGDEDVVSCDEINNKHEGVIYIYSNLTQLSYFNVRKFPRALWRKFF